MAKRGGLGKGLDALFLDNDAQVGGGLMDLRLSAIEPNKEQPRGKFSQDSLAELADSIREHGVLQPIVVRPLPGGGYQIVAGERRWRAARMAGLSEIPAVVVEARDDKVMELALIENLQREDLTPLEEAAGYRTLMETYGLTQEQVAKRMGKSRPAIANALRLLNLPRKAMDRLERGELTPGHARVLAGLEPELAEELAEETARGGLTVRQLEKLAAQRRETPRPPRQEKPREENAWGDSGWRELELSLKEALGRPVKIRSAPGGGRLEIPFYSLEDLTQIANLLAK